MTTVQLRSRVLSRLEKTDNMDLLEAVESMIHAFDSSEGDVYKLSHDEQLDVNTGLEDMRNGNVLPNDEANRQTREWLRGKSSGRVTP